MIITYFKNTSDKRKLNKTITQLGQETLLVKDVISMVNPEIIVTEFVEGCNYFYLDTFNRYYFIEDQQILQGHRVKLVGHCDVLMSHKSDINKIGAVVSRSTNGGNKYLVDPAMKTLNKDGYETIPFPNGFETTLNYVLTVCG